MKSQLNPMPEIKEDYSKIFNTMAILSVLGSMFIFISLPLVFSEPTEADALPQKWQTTINAPEVTMPDVSYAFECKANKEYAKSVVDTVSDIKDQIDSVDINYYTQTYVGEFYITMYAATVEQCGSTSGITASGRKCTEDPTCWTVAVDPKIIPLGTYLKIDLEGYEDVVFRADDTGSAIQNYDIDIYSSSEAESKAFPCYSGVKVWIVEVD